MNQLSFFDNPPKPPHNGTPTSIAAAEAVEPRAGTLRAMVLAFVRERGEQGATRYEMSAATGITLQSICARVSELRKAGFIRGSGRTRKSPHEQEVEILEAVSHDRERLILK